MGSNLDTSWHLAENADEMKVAEFEFQLWRVFNSFVNWQEDCQRFACGEVLSAQELSLLHIIRMREQPKNIYELCRLLNRDDPHNIQYCVKKLVKIGLVEAVKGRAGAKLAYRVTEAGLKSTEKYRDARRDLLIKLLKDFGLEKIDIERATTVMGFLRGVYDEASRLTVTYKS